MIAYRRDQGGRLHPVVSLMRKKQGRREGGGQQTRLLDLLFVSLILRFLDELVEK